MMRIPTNYGFQNQYLLISQQYQNLNNLYLKQASQKKLINPSDDPVLAQQINTLSKYGRDIDSYSQNLILAQNRLNAQENAVKDAISVADQVRQLLSQANNVMADSNTKIFANQLQGLLSNLLNTANRQDGANNFIFSGDQPKNQTYQLQSGSYVYQGGMNPSNLNISSNVQVSYGEAGYNIFDHISSGNGYFTVNATTTNTGSALVFMDGVTSMSGVTADDYTLSFVTNSSGDLAYQVTGTTSGQVIPVPPATVPADAPAFSEKEAISFNGINLIVRGVPKAGDSFSISPSQPGNVFNTMQDMIDLLNSPLNVNDEAQRSIFLQSISQFGQTFDQVFNQFVSYQTKIGQELSYVSKQSDINNQLVSDTKSSISSLSDVDSVETLSSISQQSVYLQATQSIYMEIQKVLMDLMRL